MKKSIQKNSFYITTTLPYVNAQPHIGFGLEIVAADVIARYHRLLGEDVIFNTGTDEHGQKIYEKALKNNQKPQDYADYWAGKFAKLQKLLNLNYTHFIRTTNHEHKKAAQEFWRRCSSNGYIYKKMYRIKYCVGCELEKQDSELVDGRCHLHPSKELESREEENYFFKFSEFGGPLLDFYEANPHFVKPEGKFKEIKSFVKSGLKDFSISRLKTKMPWGVEVPGDPKHVMYVWFDALVNYISTLGWPGKTENFVKYWGTKNKPQAVQIAGKDNLRQQSAMWQAMLMAANLPNSKQILINGFISIGGQKMSKSLGNVISPQEMVTKYGIDGTRFLLMLLGPVGNDMDISWSKLDIVYTAHLANGLGNLCSRIAKMAEKYGAVYNHPLPITQPSKKLDVFEIKEELSALIQKVSQLDNQLTTDRPWEMRESQAREYLQNPTQGMISKLLTLFTKLKPFIPQTSQKIIKHFSGGKILALKPLFPRIKNSK